MVNDKDTEVVMRLLPKGDKYHYIFTTPSTQRARSAEEMLKLWEGASPLPSPTGKGVAINNPKEAINYALNHASDDDAVFIGGSNYLVGEALEIGNWKI
jgi:dihydrofolate synthase/folylpolyglutamate synthase